MRWDETPASALPNVQFACLIVQADLNNRLPRCRPSKSVDACALHCRHLPDRKDRNGHRKP